MITHHLLRVALAGSTWVLWFLLALSVVSFTAMLERFLFFRKRKDDASALRTRVAKALRDGDVDAAEAHLARSPSVEADVVRSALAYAKGGPEAVLEAVDSALSATKKELEKGMNLLGTLGNNAPFVGLFGTVLGVIEAFHELSGGASKSAMGSVMSGIAEALVATGVGLFVALPAVVAYNVAQKRIGEIETDTWSLAKIVTASLRLLPAYRGTSDAVHEDVPEGSGERLLSDAKKAAR